MFQTIFKPEQEADDPLHNYIEAGDDGRVRIETETRRLSFRPVKILKPFYKTHIVRVKYTVFMTEDSRALTFARNCDGFMIESIFKNVTLHTFENEEEITGEPASKTERRIKISLNGLKSGRKYYGAIVVDVDLLPLEHGYLTPMRSEKLFYEDFVWKNEVVAMPIRSIISVVAAAFFFVGIIVLVKNYVFGQVGGYQAVIKNVDVNSKEKDDDYDLTFENILEGNMESDPPATIRPVSLHSSEFELRTANF